MKKYSAENIDGEWAVVDNATGSIVSYENSELAAWAKADELSDYGKRH